MTEPLEARWNAAAGLLATHRDVLDARPVRAAAPAALVGRGWAGDLLALADDTLEALEIDGFAASPMPPVLAELAAKARAACDLPVLDDEARSRPRRRRETPRKRAQVDAFVAVANPLLERARRIVDVGSGHGHLTRAVAERAARPVVGLDRDARLTGTARALSHEAHDAHVTFAIADVLAGALPLERGDCAIGLHACGELGDAIVTRAAAAGASVALVACCPQKRRAARASLVAPQDARLTFPTRLLGLGNLSARDHGVEADRSANLAARERRLALHRLLEDRLGAPLRFGAEMDGLNRRAANDDLATLVMRAFAHHRLPPPDAPTIERAAARARDEHAVVRRLSLPRAMLARVLETFVLLDRALWLERQGCEVTIGLVFPASISARNLGLFARAPGLPCAPAARA